MYLLDLYNNGKTIGPYDEHTVISFCLAGQLCEQTLVCKVGEGQWVPITHSCFSAAFEKGKSTTIKELFSEVSNNLDAHKNKKPIIIGMLALLVSACVIYLVANMSKNNASELDTHGAHEYSQFGPAKKPPSRNNNLTQEELQELDDEIALDNMHNRLENTNAQSVDTLADALQIISPQMDDHYGNDISPSAAVLALWMISQSPKSIWDSLDSMPDHKRTEIEKDIIPFRGKKLCSRGRIIQIMTDRSTGTPIYYGVLNVGWSGFIRFIAVGSSEGIIENSHVRFCGIVIGLHSYDNRLGGSTSGIEVVGLFDIKNNR